MNDQIDNSNQAIIDKLDELVELQREANNNHVRGMNYSMSILLLILIALLSIFILLLILVL